MVATTCGFHGIAVVLQNDCVVDRDITASYQEEFKLKERIRHYRCICECFVLGMDQMTQMTMCKVK